jgi:hypothetical protein
VVTPGVEWISHKKIRERERKGKEKGKREKKREKNPRQCKKDMMRDDKS